jgi:hypothetical protein
MSPPQFESGGGQAMEMLLVNRLAGDAECLGYLCPRPTGAHRPLDRGIFELVGHSSQSHDRGEAIRWSTKRIGGSRFHASNFSC